MGGSLNLAMFGIGAGNGQQQFTPAQYTDSQMMDYAKQNSGNFDMLQQYQNAIKEQLRNGSYNRPEQVWAQVRNSNDKAAFDKAQNQLLMQQADGQSDSSLAPQAF